MLALIRAKRSLQLLITVWLLTGMSVTFCQACLAHATDMNRSETIPDKSHCAPDKDAVPSSSHSDHQPASCDCDCDSLTANVIAEPKALSMAKPSSLPDVVLTSVDHFETRRHQVTCTIPLPAPPERSTIPPLERSCVQLK